MASPVPRGHLASASTDGTIRLWEVESGQVLATLQGHEGGVMSVAFSPEGTRRSTESSSREWLTQANRCDDRRWLMVFHVVGAQRHRLSSANCRFIYVLLSIRTFCAHLFW